MAKQRINIRVDPELWAAVHDTARKRGTNDTEVVEAALREHHEVRSSLAVVEDVREDRNGALPSSA